MSELTIDGKTFISSKRAAEITGYAKDYVGQLCREGRVTAKLVGRAWYVLESSIMEHRYASEQAKEAVKEPKKGGPGIKSLSSTWETPTYAAELPETIPEMPAKPEGDAQPGTVAAMQAAWQEWFSMKRIPELEPEHLLADHEEVPDATSMPQNTTLETHEEEVPAVREVAGEAQEEAVQEVSAPVVESQAVSIPIERIRRPSINVIETHHIPQQKPLEAIQTVHYEEEPLSTELAEDYEQGGPVRGLLKAVAAVVIIVGIVIGVLGSGTVTPYLKQYGLMGYTSYISGTSEYSK